jgi:hypothetical protein
MSHPLRVVAKRPCRLDRGVLRRVSQDRQQLLSTHHPCCPRCGFVTVAFNGNEGLAITESGDCGEFGRGLSEHDMANLGVGFPPYYALCRTTTVADV